MSKPQQSRWLVLLPLMLAILGGSLANSMTNTALPKIAAALSVSVGSRAWIVGAFPLALAVTMVAAARLGDHYGRRRLMLAGLAVVAVVNIVPAFVSDGVELIACRAVLGVAGAMILASVVSTIGHTFRGHDLAIANGAWVTVFGVGSAAGPILGGVLTQALGWRSVFLCLSPLAVATAALAWWLMPESMAPGPRARWDVISLALSVTTVGGRPVPGRPHLPTPLRRARFRRSPSPSALAPESPSSARSRMSAHPAGSSSPWPRRRCSRPRPPPSRPAAAPPRPPSPTRQARARAPDANLQARRGPGALALPA